MKAVAVGVLVMLLAACSSGSRPPLTNRSIADFELDLWVSTEDLTAACMREAGFDYQPRTYQGEPISGLGASPFDFDFSMEQARTTGFGIVDGLVSSLSTDTPPALASHKPGSSGAEDDARHTALYGSPASGQPGCRAQAEASARTQLKAEADKVEGRLTEVGQRIEHDPRYVQMWQQWSNCMATNGIQASDMMQLTEDFARQATVALVVPLPRPSRGQHPSDQSPPKAGGAPDPTVVAQFRGQEITLATAAVGCLEPLRSTYLTIVADAEGQ